ncbi:MAG TPA: hypothetical protein PL033_02220 [Candidatus Brocadiia bacterium]|nr:hypothetical protein [Candidatus Brocadiia bacterium]
MSITLFLAIGVACVSTLIVISARKEPLDGKLAAAGMRGLEARTRYNTLRAVAALVGALMACLLTSQCFSRAGIWSFQDTLLLLMLLTLVGFRAPDFWLISRRNARQRAMVNALPDVLDRFSANVLQNGSLATALDSAIETAGTLSRDLAEELLIVRLELKAGVPEREALENLGSRTALAETRMLALLLPVDNEQSDIAFGDVPAVAGSDRDKYQKARADVYRALLRSVDLAALAGKKESGVEASLKSTAHKLIETAEPSLPGGAASALAEELAGKLAAALKI